ncbi:MAG: phosphonate ABC transporter substrate-binding protein [Methylothermaceae bacteria B42]|nr:MAG: phosphonate ABC transporter substrate-binding protein [Methylothermaceae bacteria B42]HHJ39485.1 phosphonate ABC transporter substrate-binding protein [Methylothermaceae bacterium]
MGRFCKKILAVLFGLAWLGPVCAQMDLKFGVYTTDKPTAVVKKLRPVLNQIQSRLQSMLGEPVRIRMQIARSYAKGIEDLIAGKVDFARLGPASYVGVKRRYPDIRLLALESNNGRKRFSGVIVVHRNSTINSVKELKGKTFAFGDSRSTIGRYLSQQYLYQAGLRASDLKKYEYLGRHDRVGWAVADGTFDAGALKEGTFKKLVQQGAPLRVLAAFENVTKPWVARFGLSQQLFTALQKSLLSLGKERFLPPEEGDFAFISQAMDSNHQFFSPALSP